MNTEALKELDPAQAKEQLIDYAMQYGGRCRDCADARVEGVCDTSGLPCDPAIQRKVLSHALDAWDYGAKHGFCPALITLLREERSAREKAERELAEVRAERDELERNHEAYELIIGHKTYQEVADEIGRVEELSASYAALEARATAAESELARLRGELAVQRECKEHARRECDKAKAEIASLRKAGAALANIAYNLAQHDEIAERHRRSMREACAEWDDVSLARIRAAIEPAPETKEPAHD